MTVCMNVYIIYMYNIDYPDYWVKHEVFPTVLQFHVQFASTGQLGLVVKDLEGQVLVTGFKFSPVKTTDNLSDTCGPADATADATASADATATANTTADATDNQSAADQSQKKSEELRSVSKECGLRVGDRIIMANDTFIRGIPSLANTVASLMEKKTAKRTGLDSVDMVVDDEASADEAFPSKGLSIWLLVMRYSDL